MPLSTEAVRIAVQLASVRDGPMVFQIKAPLLDALFRKARRKSELDDSDLQRAIIRVPLERRVVPRRN